MADRLEARGWSVNRSQHPAAIHLTCTANHLAVVDDYLTDLRAACAEVRADPSLKQSGSAPMYGMMAKLPLRGMVKQSVKKVMQAMYMPGVVVPDVGASAQDGVVGKIIDRYGPQIDAALDKLAAVRGALGRRR